MWGGEKKSLKFGNDNDNDDNDDNKDSNDNKDNSDNDRGNNNYNNNYRLWLVVTWPHGDTR